MLLFGAYFGLRQDIWFLEVGSNLSKVITAKSKFSCSVHISAFGRRCWFLEVASRLPKVVTAKGKFSSSEHILSKVLAQILMFGAYLRLRQDMFLKVASTHVVTAKVKFSCLDHILASSRIPGFWRLAVAFQKWSQQRPNSYVRS